MKNNLTNLLMDIPTILCRNMNKQFVDTVLKELESDFSQHHFMVLKLLNENSQLYVTEIVKQLSITKPQMTATIDKLIRLNYVERYYDNNDRRKIYLSITNEGENKTSEIINLLDKKIAINLIKMTDNETAKMTEGIKLLFKFCTLYK